MSLKKRTQQGTGPNRPHGLTDPHPFYGSSEVTTQPPSQMKRHYTWISEYPIDPRSREPTLSLAALRDTVDRSVDIALDMLSSRKGREFLDEVGSRAIKQWGPTQHVYRGTKNDKMGNCVNAFLKQVGTEFVPICLMAAQPAIADFRMKDWYKKGTREVAQWSPRSAGTLCLSRMVVEVLFNCIKGTTPAAKKDEVHSGFSLTVAIARELVNCFIGRLSGHEAPAMPNDPDYPSWGFLWQWMMFGGVIVEFEAPEHPFTNTCGRVDQPGDVWAVEDADTARRLSENDMLGAMYRCDNTFPLRFGGTTSALSLRQLFAHTAMEELRADLFEQPPDGSSLPLSLKRQRDRKLTGNARRSESQSSTDSSSSTTSSQVSVPKDRTNRTGAPPNPKPSHRTPARASSISSSSSSEIQMSYPIRPGAPAGQGPSTTMPSRDRHRHNPPSPASSTTSSGTIPARSSTTTSSDDSRHQHQVPLQYTPRPPLPRKSVPPSDTSSVVSTASSGSIPAPRFPPPPPEKVLRLPLNRRRGPAPPVDGAKGR